MKALLLILMSLILVNCGGKNWSANTTAKATDNPIVNDDIDNNDDDDNDDDDDDDLVCPRYDLIVKSTHTTDKKLNFKYTFNAEMTHTTVQGKHKVNFTKSQYNSCSGKYTNSSILTSLVPLQATEDLTAEVMIIDGASCVTTARDTSIQVLDAATNTVLFDEANLKTQFGCEFGYTDDGKAIRAKLVQLADAVANAKGTACN